MSIENISLDVEFVRSQFPAFSNALVTKWSFFENAGGSYVPQKVINHLNNFICFKWRVLSMPVRMFSKILTGFINSTIHVKYHIIDVNSAK